MSDDASGLKVTLGNFSQDDDALQAEHKTFLKSRIVPLLNGNADRRLWLMGRAGSSEPCKADVGTERANAVAGFLLGQGVDGAQLGAEGGQISDGPSDARARAVDLVLLPPTSAPAAADKCEVASKQEIEAAQDAVDEARRFVAALIRAQDDWLRGNLGDFIFKTVTAPTWEAPLVRRWAALGSGILASQAVKYAGPTLTEIGTVFGLPGLVITVGLYALKKAAASSVANFIAGEKELTPAQKSSKDRDAVRMRWEKTSKPLEEAREGAIKDVEGLYGTLRGPIKGGVCSRVGAKAIMLWAAAEKARAEALLKAWSGFDKIESKNLDKVVAQIAADRSLLPSLLITWLADHSQGPTDPALDTDNVDWKSACNDVFGDQANGIPKGVYWAMQLHAEWSQFGLSTEQTEQWIAAGSPPLDLRRGGTVTFDNALDSTALLVAAGIDIKSDAAKRLEQDPSGCRVTCDFIVDLHPNYFYRYTKSAQYHLEIGSDIFPFNGATRKG